MSIYRSAPVDEAPDVVLSHWSIRQDVHGSRYFVGFSELQGDGRVSTPIVKFDVDRRIGFTASGRRYILVGRGGSHGDGDYVWGMVVAARGLSPWRDVTPELVPNWRIPFRGESLWSGDGTSLLNAEDIATLLEGEANGSVEPSATHISTLPVFWRARAFGLTVGEASPTLRLLSEVSGECELRSVFRRRVSRPEMYLHAARAALHAQEHAGGRIDPEALTPWCLKIWVTALQSLDDRVGDPVARLDALCSDQSAIASLRSTDWCDHKIGPFPFATTDGIWEIFLRALDLHERSQRR